jgi:dimeric dUTPase (all-alpha-NTP-PPase superfamily)
MLSNETLKKLQTEQKKLDEFIIQKKNLTDIDNKKGFTRIKIALLVEIGELANELKTFKHWKNQKEVNWEKAKEELIDCLHFYLSWVNHFQIDFSDYKFCKMATDPDYNELLLALFSETETFSIYAPWKVRKLKMLAVHEKSWENDVSKLDPEDKDYKKNLEDFREIKEKIRHDIEKMSDNFLEGISEEKNKQSFYRWLIIFEELARKLGMKSEKDIENAYMAKNKINWERQKSNY